MLVVHKEWRKRGIGSKLVGEAIKGMHQGRCEEVITYVLFIFIQLFYLLLLHTSDIGRYLPIAYQQYSIPIYNVPPLWFYIEIYVHIPSSCYNI